MKNRLLTFWISSLLTVFAAAQGNYTVLVVGGLPDCTPGGTVTLQTGPGTLPSQMITVQTNANCSFGATFLLDSPTGSITAVTSCGFGAMAADTGYYTFSAPVDTASFALVLNCGGLPPPCQAEFTVEQTAPFTALFTSTTTGGSGTYTYLWDFSDAGGVTGNPALHDYAAPGTYTVCLNVEDDNGVSCNTCQEVVVGADGTINPCTPPTITGMPGPITLCSTDSLNVSATATGTAPLYYHWTGPGIIYADSLNGFVFGTATTGTYQVSVQNSCGAADSTMTVTAVPAPDAGIVTDNFLCDLTGPTSLFSLLGGTPDAGGSWTFAGVPHSDIFDPNVDSIGFYAYTVAGTAPCPNAFSGVYIVGMPSWYADADGDGFGDPASAPVISCTEPTGYVSNSSDNCPGTYGVIGSPCDDGNPATSDDHLTVDCLCLGLESDCLGNPGGNALPGTACTVPATALPGTWSINCVCVPDSGTTNCQACIGLVQDSSNTGLIPFQAVLWSCSSGGVDPYTYSWSNGTGLIIGTTNVLTYTFPGPGTFLICLTMADAAGCTSTTCDTVIVDENGTINPTDPLPCDAGFWAIQAYDSTAGGVEPIPNEVWVWNLSSGGNGTYEFFWDFGDGSTSSDPFPTHEYDGPGPWLLCLTMTSGDPASGCTDTYCDTLSMDANGILNGMVIQGHGAVHSSSNNRSGGFTVNVIQEIPSGIGELPAIADVKVWPNPVRDMLNISFHSGFSGTVPVTVIAPDGRMVLSGNHQFSGGNASLQLPTDRLGAGLYMVRIGSGANSVTQRFLKVR